MIKDKQIEAACTKASTIIESEKNRELITEAVEAVTKLARENSALRSTTEIQEEIIKGMRGEFKRTLCKYKIAYGVFICVILLLLVL
jgi:hypothetical protein